MKKFLILFSLFTLTAAAFPAWAQEGYPENNPNSNGSNGGGYPKEKSDSGWFIGTDQGVLFFVGTGGNFIDPQYYSSFFGGYNIHGIVQPILRLSQAIGSTSGFFNATTFFFTVEGGVRVTPLRTKFRPYFIGTIGFYHLDFNDFLSPVADDSNLTFTGGGGIEYEFGASRIGLGSEYRGFINDRLDLRSVQVTFGYTFQF